MRFGFGLAVIACMALVLACNGAQLTTPDQPDGDDAGSSSQADAGKKKKDAGPEASTGDDDDDDDDNGGGDDQADASTTPDASHADAGPMEAGAPPGGTTDVSLLVEPSDKGAALFNAIKGAKTSIHMTMYLLTDDTFIGDLTAQAAKIEVKAILNENFPSSGSDSGSNAASYTALQNGGVDVVWAPPGFTYTHEKAVIIDGTQLWILTNNGTYSGRTSNREYMVADNDAADVAEAEAIFEADFANHNLTPSGKLLASPDNMRAGLDSLIGSATSTLDFEVEEFYDTGIAAAFCSATARGVKVRGVVADLGQSHTDTPYPTLAGCGVTFVQLDTPYVHAKAIVADGVRAYVGSANFSSTSLDHNRELGGIFTDATAVKSVATTVAGDIASGSSF
jgi:phosphatidylserine/phosphatidylglycerophosphate/cardiolipin synthase-like enzyme